MWETRELIFCIFVCSVVHCWFFLSFHLHNPFCAIMNAEERRGIVDETVQHLTQMLAEAEFLNPDRNQTNLGVQNTRN